MNKKDNIRAIAGASLLQCALIGILVNTSGTFFSPIVAEYGFAMTRLSAFNIIKSAAGALTGAAATALMYRSDLRKYMLGVVSVICAGFVMLTVGANTVLWYIAPALVSFSSTVGIIAVPYILGQRLSRGAGSATGFAMAFSGVGGVVFNPIAAFLIQKAGWRATILILCATTMAFALAGLWLLFGKEKTADRAGAAAVKKTAQKEKIDPRMRKRFVLCVLSLLCGTVCTAFVPFVNLYAEGLGYSAVVAATAASAVMAGNIGGKLLFGVLCDVVGTWKAMLASGVCVFAGLLGMVLFSRFLGLFLACAALFGMSYSLATIAVSKCAQAAYGEKMAKRFTGTHTGITCAAGAVGSLGIGIVHDALGSFVPVICMIAAVVAVSFAATWITKAEVEKKQ